MDEKNVKKRVLTGFFIEDLEGKWRLPETIGNYTRHKNELRNQNYVQ